MPSALTFADLYGMLSGENSKRGSESSLASKFQSNASLSPGEIPVNETELPNGFILHKNQPNRKQERLLMTNSEKFDQ